MQEDLFFISYILLFGMFVRSSGFFDARFLLVILQKRLGCLLQLFRAHKIMVAPRCISPLQSDLGGVPGRIPGHPLGKLPLLLRHPVPGRRLGWVFDEFRRLVPGITFAKSSPWAFSWWPAYYVRTGRQVVRGLLSRRHCYFKLFFRSFWPRGLLRQSG